MLFIVNPVSALGSTQATWLAARAILRSYGVKFDEVFTNGPGNASSLAAAAIRGGEKRIIAVGGDGTLNEVVNGYFDESGTPLDDKVAIGLLPSGTGSDFQKTLGINDLDYAVSTIRADATDAIDVARVRLKFPAGGEGIRYLVNISTIGLGGEAVRLVNGWRLTWPSVIPGNIRFIAGALVALVRFDEQLAHLTLDGVARHLSTGLIVVANGRFAGAGMMFAPSAELNDGLLDVVVTENINRLDVMRELSRIMNGTYLRNPKVRLLQASSLKLASDHPFAVDIDGEFAGYSPLEIEVIPKALRFILPAGLKAVMAAQV